MLRGTVKRPASQLALTRWNASKRTRPNASWKAHLIPGPDRLWGGVSACDDPQRFLESWLAQVAPELLPMNPSVNYFRMMIPQADFARPEAPLKIAVCGQGLTPVYRLTVRAQTKKTTV